jgi:hypothetical protein
MTPSRTKPRAINGGGTVKTIGCAALALLAALTCTLEASAQFRPAPLPGNDWGTARINVGLFRPLSTFHDDTYGESRFESGAAIGASVLAFPWQGRLGFGAQLFRSRTDGSNEQHEFAPLAVNDPVQWVFTADVVLRQVMDAGYPYVSAGAGLKQYNWATSRHREDRFFVWNLAAGYELRANALGSFGLNAELRYYRSSFIGFGIDGGNWRPGDQLARPGVGFYGGVVDGQPTSDLLLTLGLSVPF